MQENYHIAHIQNLLLVLLYFVKMVKYLTALTSKTLLTHYVCALNAERNALYNAMMNGYKKSDFVALAIVADTDDACSPCGACSQVISELFPEEGNIYLANLKGAFKETNIKELLPFAFSGDDLD